VGAGPIGLAIVQVLKTRGISNIIVAEVSERRRLFAQTLGATTILNPTEVDMVAQVRTLTGD
jgi:threonine dehydrogenase-like Zn-dependent dehydrogenase